MNANPIVIFHDHCHDGITALWAVKQALPDAEPYPGSYNAAPDLERLKGRHVVFVDFCWKLDVMRDVADVAASMLVLDHHASAAKDLLESPGWFFGTGYGDGPCPRRAPITDLTKYEGALTWERHMASHYQDLCENAHINGAPIECYFDVERSGAGIAWDFFHPGKQRPKLIDYVEDRDLWRFMLPFSREVHAWCGSYPLTLEARERLVRDLDAQIKDFSPRPSPHDGPEYATWPCICDGAAILRYHDRLVADVVRVALTEEIGGHVVPSVCCPNLALASDIGHALAKGRPFAAVWHERPDGSRYVGLRSTDDGLDVSEVAKQYGGGGHRNAAGFTRPPPGAPLISTRRTSSGARSPQGRHHEVIDQALHSLERAEARVVELEEKLKSAVWARDDFEKSLLEINALVAVEEDETMTWVEPVKRVVEERDALRAELAAVRPDGEGREKSGSIVGAEYAVGQIRAQCDVLERRLGELHLREGGHWLAVVRCEDAEQRLHETRGRVIELENKLADARAESKNAQAESKRNYEALQSSMFKLNCAERDLAAVLRVQEDHQRYANELLERARKAEDRDLMAKRRLDDDLEAKLKEAEDKLRKMIERLGGDEVVKSVFEERERQDEQWGGPSHDDEHGPDEWTGFVMKQVRYADQRPYQYRARIVKVAALALAALASFDRRAKLG